MSEASEKARSAAKDKAKRLTEVPASSVDASGWTEAPCGFMHMDKKTGNRPISKQNLKTGGRAAHKHGGRKGRDMGGPAAGGGQPLVASVPLPPQNRFSFTGQPSPFLGAAGMKKGGKAKRADGGVVHEKGAQNPEIIGNRPVGGRIPRKDGGSAKGKTTVNIIIAQKPDKPQMPMGGPPVGAPPPARPMPMPPPPGGAPPPGGPQGMPAGPMPGGPNMPPPSMARASGGRAYPIDSAAGGGKGRLEKIKAYGAK